MAKKPPKKKKVKRKDIKKIAMEGPPPALSVNITPADSSSREEIHTSRYSTHGASEPTLGTGTTSKYKSKSALRKAGLLIGEGKEQRVITSKAGQHHIKL